MSAQPIQRRRRLVDVEVLTPQVEGVPGHVAAIQLRVTNLDSVIRSYDITVLGFDPALVTLTPAVVDLFPDEETVATVRIDLPEDHAAGRHAISIQVSRPDDAPVVVDALVEIAAREGLQLTTEPASLEMGGTGTFLLHLHNTGNTGLPVELLAQDPERLVEVTFDPPAPVVPPGSRSVVQATATGPRPWVGLPVVRVLDVTVRSRETEAVTAVALVQAPRISRRIIAFLGLLAMISLFALVITLSFGRVADLTARNEALVRQGLGFDEPAGARAAPTEVLGVVVSSTGGPIDGAAIELYEQDNPLRPFQTTVTDADGAYRFTAVPAGDYLIRTVVAGFGALWHPGVLDLADAELVTVEEGAGVDGLAAVLTGQPGGVSGIILGDDVEGAVLTVQLPADSIEGSDVEPVAAVVQAIEIDATGRFELGGLTTPATYEIVVSKPGFADETRTVTLGAGQVREDIEILLGRGIGVISGTVVDAAGAPVGGVDITATDGTTETRTRSLGGEDETAGGFELRDLDVPATWTLTFTAPGYFTETRTIQVTGAETPEATIVMTADGGSLGGVVRTANGTGVSNATVTVSGADLERSTWTLSVGEVGRWFVGDLPAPGTYTVTVAAPGFVTNAVSVELAAGPAANRSDVDVRLAAALVTVRGLVTDLVGDPISGVEVTLEGTGLQRTTRTSDDPLGAYVFDRLPAGVYTLTYRRAGSTVQTLLVDLPAGTDRTLDDVRLEQQAAITGVVREDGVGQSDVGVLVYRADDYPDGVTASTITGTGGTFSIDGLDAPESYIVEFRVPAGGSAVASRTVELRPGETVELEVDL